MIKVLHPSANEIKDNINNMMGYDKKSNIINDEEKVIRVKYKRTFFGKNKFYKKYDERGQILLQKIKDNLKNWKDKYIYDIIYSVKSLLILFDEMIFYIYVNGDSNIIYKNIKDVKYNKNKIVINYINNKKNEKENENGKNTFVVEINDEFMCEKIYLFLKNIISK